MDEGKNNYTWCWQCENWKEVLGHSEINCPNVVCRNCGLVGHIRPDCPHPSVNIPSVLELPSGPSISRASSELEPLITINSFIVPE